MDFDLIMPTALDFLLSVLFLEDVKIEESMSLDIVMQQSTPSGHFLKTLSQSDKDRLISLSLPKIY
jgi:hypothetical protein